MSSELIGSPGHMSGSTFVATNNTGDIRRVRRGVLTALALMLGVVLLIVLVKMTAFHDPFTIPKGGNLIKQVGFDQALDIAHDNALLIYVVENGTRRYIATPEARRLKNKTDDVRVVVLVYPGDRFEKRWWHWRYTPSAGPTFP